LILSLLKELESRPGLSWSRAELLERNGPAVANLVAAKLLRRLERGDSHAAFEHQGRLAELVEEDGELRAYDPDDQDWEPPSLQATALDVLGVDVGTVSAQLASRQGLVGSPAQISERLWFVGEVTSSIAVLLGFFGSRREALGASVGVPALIGSRFTGRVLVCPSDRFQTVDERTLESLNMSVAHLVDDSWSMSPTIDSCAARVAGDTAIGGFDLDTGFRYSHDFRSVQHRGTRYGFQTLPAAAVQLLFEAHKAGTPDLSDAWVMERIGSKQAGLKGVFDGHTAWGTLIVEGETRGTHRLELS